MSINPTFRDSLLGVARGSTLNLQNAGVARGSTPVENSKHFVQDGAGGKQADLPPLHHGVLPLHAWRLRALARHADQHHRVQRSQRPPQVGVPVPGGLAVVTDDDGLGLFEMCLHMLLCYLNSKTVSLHNVSNWIGGSSPLWPASADR